ncbi:Z1 domain-containing protein [Kaistia terrae]|uniref:Z1 domain-containing protein n=1 Tax=Kaistia terrae TaxID=537017 RepID=A0ABW0Q2A0_9HYPH|nr:Z1 domain-containing protein [Kaistia terrae]MCX5578992.1 Z1 domain-containing protein [Kaistia terrae]
MRNLDAERAYLRLKIAGRFQLEMSVGAAIPKEAIAEEVEGSPFLLAPDERDTLVRELEESFTTTQKRGAAVRAEYKPWLNKRRQDVDWYYWDRLRRYYMEGNRLPPQVVATLDTVTDEILDYCGNPVAEGEWKRRGMVMGHVQSGKTTNYSALICKAADAGYKVIILLAGITNSLRSQTQERIDDTFIGRKSVFNAAVIEGLPLQNYATKKRTPAYGTSRDRDFTEDAAGVFFSLEAHNEPIIFVTKKNSRTLETLFDWLETQQGGGRMSYPMLLIDDEADNASINTSKDPKKTTVINGYIRKILHKFYRSTYIGYTATPFANIFIDPDNESEMLGDDLFPRHFIKALDPPSNYVGASKIFAPKGDLRATTVRNIGDYQNTLPLAHKRNHLIGTLPDSLKEAVRVWCLTRGLRYLRGHEHQHCSMMINVSRFNDVQETVLGLVYAYLEAIRNALTANGGLPLQDVRDSLIGDLGATFEKEFSESGHGFGDVLPILDDALKGTVMLTVNMRGGTLDYARHRSTGLRVIAIGGLALSRGLTLEDLTVSYILRNTAASDTLMQMARWFGYRNGYEDLCRVYLPKVSLEHYEQVNEAIEELRSEVKRMQLNGLTPADFGLRVRESPTAIRITAASKMRTAKKMTIAQSYAGRHIEGYALFNDSEVNAENCAAVGDFLAALGSRELKEGHVLWTANGTQVLALLDRFQFADAHGDLKRVNGRRSLLGDYISDRLKADLEVWDVAIPHLQSGVSETPPLFGIPFPMRRRHAGMVVDVESEGASIFRVTGMKNRIADPGDVKFGMAQEELAAATAEREDPDGERGDSAFCRHRKRPLLLIHAFRTNGIATNTEGAKATLKLVDPVVSLSFALPTTAIRAVPRTYQVNKVYVVQLDMMAEPDDDQEAVEAGNV